MVRSLLLTLTALLISTVAVVAQTVLAGTITDGELKEPQIGASVKILKGTAMVRGVVTDTDGKFRVQLDPGQYNVEVSYTGYATQRVENVRVLEGKTNVVDIVMESSAAGTLFDEVIVKGFKVPLVEQDQTSTGKALTADQIKNLPTRSVNAIVATTAGVSSVEGGDVTIKGSRPNGTNYYIDGIRVAGTPPPVQDIEQLQIITGGLGAEYGDLTGGLISITTKGPAGKYNGSIEVENSHGLDPYGWLLATANVSGPIWKKKVDGGKQERTIIGFRLSGQYNSQRDDDPPALPVARAKGEFLGADKPFGQQFTEGSVLDNLQQNPLYRRQGAVLSSAERLTQDSVDYLNYNPFEGRTDIDVTTRLDFKPSDKIDFSITGTYRNSENQFTPGGFGDNNWLLLNAHNNPTQYSDRRRIIGRFRHRLGNQEREAENKSNFGISNANYELQFAFERGTSEVYDPRHKDNLFNYGYVGRFDFTYQPIITFIDNQFTHVGYRSQFEGYQPGNLNPGLAVYNQFANPEFEDSYLARNGRFTSVYDDVWSGMYRNMNFVYDNFQKTENDIITIRAASSFDLKLGKNSIHSIQFGLLNEQRTDRSYVLQPFDLYEVGRRLINRHLLGLDTSVIIRYDTVNGIPVPIYPNAVIAQSDATFYRSIREKLGVSLDTEVNMQSITPDQLDLSMFNAFELTEYDNNFLEYSGYTYTGERLGGGFTFNDFFTHRNANGDRDFPVAPLTPLYQAAYIKDKFTINKMIFSLGVRVERFDLNTRVMRDPYSLYEIMDAKTYFADHYSGPRPGTIGDDFKVYTAAGYSDKSPVAYRSGDTWYTDKGQQVNDATLIFGGGVIAPLLADTINGDNIRSENFNPNSAFADYTPQVNILPRIAFSFPINEDANFFAHYDELVQRPTNYEVTALDYYYFYTAGRTPTNNAALKPERVTDFEVGFQQKLTQNSALKFSAYYRSMEQMPQQRVRSFIPVIGRYTTVDNIDFGTVKGFTTAYDLRRIRNVEMQVAYTLQFADGTGSNSASARGRREQLRTLYPLDFDERHNIQGILDYRFDEGKRYNGPQLFGKDILALFGANIQFNAVSGRPYTARRISQRFGAAGTLGAINGNRLPWRSTIDLRLDKTFNLSAAGKNPLYLNVYFRVSNLLDRRNWANVYEFTGSPTDDGYLASAEGQQSLVGLESQGRNLDAYLAAYSWSLLDPNNFLAPRRMFVGASFSF
jgi:Carboxypeptidase regulatory-like domain/TonB-dependent Receptor Plug Domain